ncbi:MAG: class C beta-lactamase-related serine hydrolase [Cytophagales bacterium]|nr:MAG: class C beta-lactamase-related serine hydrolase [Cytophagales bacterium]
MFQRTNTLLLLFFCLAFTGSFAQRGQNVPSDYTGTYQYRNGVLIELIPKDTLLLAVLDGAQYPMRMVRKDLFINVVGDTIPFQRDASDRVISLREGKDTFARLSPSFKTSLATLFARRDVQGKRVKYVYRAPQSANDGLPVSSLKDVGLPVEPFEKMIQAIINEEYPKMHSVLIWKDGKLALEEYFFGHDRQSLHQMRSASKSFVSALVGIATDKGLFANEQERVLSLFNYPNYANMDPRKQAWTINDFLTMRTGLDCNDNNPSSIGNEENMYPKSDWVKFVLDLPLVNQPGTKGSYCSGAVAVLGKALEYRSKQSLPEFARVNLFEPLGIKNFKWNYRLDSTNQTVAQVYLTPRDMLKFGLLYLNKGQWQGKQVISSAWVEKSLGKYTQLGSRQYGYFWWTQRFNVGGQVVEAWLVTGNGGQKVFVFPAYNLVAVFTGGNYNSVADSPPNEIVPKYILPAVMK